MKDLLNIGIPSKGRLRKDVLKIFTKKKLKLVSERGERDLIGSIKNRLNIKILYLHAREIIERLGDGSLDVGFSGFDLFFIEPIRSLSPLSEISFNLFLVKIFKTSFLNRPLLGIPIFIKFFIIEGLS